MPPASLSSRGLNRGKARIAVLITQLLLPSGFLQAAGPGTSAAPFLNLGFGARVSALGEAVVAIADDASTVYYNPAGLAFGPAEGPRPTEMHLSHSLHLQDIRVTQLGLMRRPYAVHLTHVGVAGIERRSSETVQPEGSFGASDVALSLAHGRRVGPVAAGAALRLIRQTIGERSASAYAVDLSVLRRFESMPVSVGAGIMNLGSSVRFIEQAYPLPTTIRAGVTYGLTRSFPHALSAQLDLPRDGAPVIRLSLEYLGFGPFALRAGYRTQGGPQRDAALGRQLGSTASGLSEFYGMFMGAGFRSKLGALDYSIVPFGELGTAHRFSIGLKFGGPKATLYGAKGIPLAQPPALAGAGGR
ncbi:MAG: PorV/PorQ family protein [Elusimicrobia bacterium]|nr:PorV/PorQ family protein [Elusimicrobiota bacterium]